MTNSSGRRLGPGGLAAVGAGGFAVLIFARTAYPTITWWDSSSYSLAAATLGISSPPGSLLLALVGWPVARLAPVAPAHALNLFAAVLAALTVGLVCVVAIRLRAIGERHTQPTWPTLAGVAAGALTFAFSGTLWSYAGRFTPYVLTPVFTCVILWTMLRWWKQADEPDAWRSLLLLGLLFGLDFSVHRTNALLIPGAVLWIAVRRPGTLYSPRAVFGATAGLVAGLAVQLLVMPVAAHTSSALNFNNPSNWARFWDYVTIKQLGGSFLLGVFPRKSPAWSVQTLDVLRVLAENFLRWRGTGGALGLLPAVAAAIGLVTLWRRDRRLALAFAGLLVLQTALTILYFNIPAGYFRTFDRHYLPICVTIAVLVACGLADVAEALAARTRLRPPSFAGVVAVVGLLPMTQLVANWGRRDASRLYFARDYAANALIQLPPNAIYFTVGDNDTFPVMYVQSAEGVRPDVAIINLSVANIPDWPEQLKRRDASFPMSLSMTQRMALAERPWRDTTIVVPVLADALQLGLPLATNLPSSITLLVKPTFGTTLLPSDVLLRDIVQTNAWRRPITFAATAGRSAMGSLAPYARDEGLYARIVPLRDPPADAALLRAHLLRADYRGYADRSIALDDPTRNLGMTPYAGLIALLKADLKARDAVACRADRDALLAKLPLDRFDPPREIREPIENGCAVPRN